MDDKMKQYVDLLKTEISKQNSQNIKIENDKLVYSLGNNYKYDISSYKQNVFGELGRALAILHLLTEYKIPSSSIFLEQQSNVGAPSKRVDVIINTSDVYNGRKCIALVECKTSFNKISDNKFSDYFKKQLYNIAHSYAKDANQPYPLTLITYEITFTNTNKISISYRWFSYPEIVSTAETGQISIDKIISRNSILAYTDPPKVTTSGVYFKKRPLTKDDLIDITNPNELKNLLKEKLHQELRNYGLAEEMAFEPIINLLLAKTWDEIQLFEKGKTEPDFQAKPEDFLNKGNFYNRMQNLFENAQVQLLKEDAKEAKSKEILDHKDKEQILLDIVPYLQRIKIRSLRFMGDDSLGDVFLDFMHSVFRQSRGLFFTHPNISRFVCKALDIQKVAEDLEKKNYKYILDPSCGSGTFLIEALRLIFKNSSIDKIKENALKILFGLDNNPKATALCKVNMVIHGDGSANVYTRDALLPLDSLPLPFVKGEYILRGESYTPECIKENHGVDFIVTNPPFSITIREEQYGHFTMKKFISFKAGATNASECLFAERWYQLLNPNGRLGAVLPFSLFDSNEYLNARLLFLCYFKVISIVGLPEHAFAPYAQQRTALVFAERRSNSESEQLFSKINNKRDFVESIKEEKIIFYDAKNIGYVRSKRQKTVNTVNIIENDLTDKIASIIAQAFDGTYQQSPQIIVKTLGEIFEKDERLILTPSIAWNFQHIESLIELDPNWEIVKVRKPENVDVSNLLICETGDITPGGAGIIIPRNLQNTTSSNKERIKKKLNSGKFGLLEEGDIIISPVRVYQKKIAVVTKSATKFMFSKDFIVLRRKEKDLHESFSLFLSLVKDENIEQLESLSSTGKSGYPKIKDKDRILEMKFRKTEIPHEKIVKLAKLYDRIYKEILGRLT